MSLLSLHLSMVWAHRRSGLEVINWGHLWLMIVMLGLESIKQADDHGSPHLHCLSPCLSLESTSWSLRRTLSLSWRLLVRFLLLFLQLRANKTGHCLSVLITTFNFKTWPRESNTHCFSCFLTTFLIRSPWWTHPERQRPKEHLRDWGERWRLQSNHHYWIKGPRQ